MSLIYSFGAEQSSWRQFQININTITTEVKMARKVSESKIITHLPLVEMIYFDKHQEEISVLMLSMYY